MTNYADEVDLSASMEEAIKELAIEGIRQMAHSISREYTGKCHYCEEPISTGIYCDADCAAWHREEQAAMARKYGRRPSELE
ncbi:hypothetical protein IFX79_004102 [Salmonella enterica]|uniref:Morphogenetic protein n=1 Tax=Salmonella enterica TaxID=28901 RepID=A0A747XMH7_SALER|nr:hypothetical protein [Salmonella enterica]EAU5131746.1 hypothetical protein [Salmonella enterica subsp. enterica serovar Oranienburg]EBK2688451.1 hypothetical protein [Salmonella enterica subsp. enterica serovar Newport]EBY0276764.1 hypothetical protein [Salmonella enterica subsp. enterica serovar Miami]ECJ2211056.1 hypothetical protein [Salmonella enterica subsp. diarizonae]EDT5022308.1 hypothetical protein [Salmonella enterica subsp. enterica]EGZ4386334.1 hypothetical protein [Salmonella